MVLTCSYYLQASVFLREPQQTLFMGTIQWPTLLKKVPSLRLYRAGHQLAVETNNETRQSTYSLPELKDVSLLTMIIIEPDHIKQVMAEDNTVNHLAITKNAPYKCFQIIRTHEQQEPIKEGEKGLIVEGWKVEQRRLRDDGIIPDDALIICYNPGFIEEVSGGNTIDLPTIHIDNTIVKKIGSEEALHDAADAYLITCLNLDTIHTKLTFDVKQHQEKKLVAFNVM